MISEQGDVLSAIFACVKQINMRGDYSIWCLCIVCTLWITTKTFDFIKRVYIWSGAPYAIFHLNVLFWMVLDRIKKERQTAALQLLNHVYACNLEKLQDSLICVIFARAQLTSAKLNRQWSRTRFMSTSFSPSNCFWPAWSYKCKAIKIVKNLFVIAYDEHV